MKKSAPEQIRAGFEAGVGRFGGKRFDIVVAAAELRPLRRELD